MSNVVPLHSLVLVIQNDHRTSVSVANRLFPPHEVITPESISTDLLGQPDRPDLINVVLNEIRHRVALKLSLGERVVLAAPAFRRREMRVQMAQLARSKGASVVYVVGNTTDTDLLAGDGVAHVIREDVRVILPLNGSVLPTLRSRFRGISVIGDIHGNLPAMQTALTWARDRRRFVWFLGDVIDCGPQSLECVVLAYNTIMCGDGAFILGNHERKIARWLVQQETGNTRTIKMSDGNRVTIDALTALSPELRMQWRGKFSSVLNRSSLMMHIGPITLVHAAAHPDVWREQRDHQGIEDYALYGEPDRDVCPPEFALAYRWVDAVPNGKTVFVGHDIRSNVAPFVVTGAKGGKVIFLDTGCGKGGPLTTADLRFDESGELHLENFNRY